VTITAWIKRDGVQAQTYTGIVFSRDGSTTAGLNFGMGPGGWGDINHELSYTWNDRPATWDWHSGLIVPDGEWVFVALVVEPTKATMYLNDASATNVLNHDIEEFDGVTRIGHDAYHSKTRFFNGTIDDVRIYNRALSAEEIRQFYQMDYHLLPASPCIDAGDLNYVAGPNETDLDGNPRVINGRIDMGAYELNPLDLLLALTENIFDLELQRGIENSLLAKLNAALQILEDENKNNDVAAINTIGAFINSVEAQRGQKISETDADNLIQAAVNIINMLIGP
jgi:hypothetical protein